MNIKGKGNPKNKGSRGIPRAHDSPNSLNPPKKRDTLEGPQKPGEIECIEDWLENVTFKKAAIGGVSETDVWKKISELNEMYSTALTAERARYNMLLKANAKREGKQTVRRAPSRQTVLNTEFAEENPEGIQEEIPEEIPERIRNISSASASRSRDAPAQAAGYPRKRTASEGIKSQTRQKEITEEEAETISRKTAAPRRKSAKPKGAPYIRTDWLDDDEEETIFDIEENLRSSSKPRTYRTR